MGEDVEDGFDADMRRSMAGYGRHVERTMKEMTEVVTQAFRLQRRIIEEWEERAKELEREIERLRLLCGDKPPRWMPDEQLVPLLAKCVGDADKSFSDSGPGDRWAYARDHLLPAMERTGLAIRANFEVVR